MEGPQEVGCRLQERSWLSAFLGKGLHLLPPTPSSLPSPGPGPNLVIRTCQAREEPTTTKVGRPWADWDLQAGEMGKEERKEKGPRRLVTGSKEGASPWTPWERGYIHCHPPPVPHPSLRSQLGGGTRRLAGRLHGQLEPVGWG